MFGLKAKLHTAVRGCLRVECRSSHDGMARGCGSWRNGGRYAVEIVSDEEGAKRRLNADWGSMRVNQVTSRRCARRIGAPSMRKL